MPKKRTKSLTSAQKKTVAKTSDPIQVKLEKWCGKNRQWIILSILLISLALRVVYYSQCSNTVFFEEHVNSESDMSYFNQWAVSIADGDLISKTVQHPQYQWMQWVSDRYFQNHPDKLELFRAKIGRDTLINNPSKLLWDQWYGKITFQQEPLYPYFIALNFSVFGKNVKWVFIFQLLLGILTNLLVYFVARRYFGDLTATIAAFLSVFFGPMLFYEMILLRSSIAVFLGILLIYLTDKAISNKKPGWWILSGITTGLALLVHSFFLFYILGTTVMLLIIYRKNLKTGIYCIAALLLGLILVMTPVMYRNNTVGAPVMSLSSTSALSFVTMNNESFKSFIGWNMSANYLSEIMGATDGKLLKTIIPTLKTHKSAKSYLMQVWDKLHATFSWYEIPNNVNFYLYREYTPVLFVTFISFLIISPLALIGIILSLIKRINAWPLYLMILVYLFPLLAFMVLSRYRILFAPILIPFAAVTVNELLGSWKIWKNYLIILAILILGYWASLPGSEKVNEITKNDYEGIWGAHFSKTAVKEFNLQHLDKVASIIHDFLNGYEPKQIKNVNPFYQCRNQNESEIFNYFYTMHANLVNIYNAIKEDGNSRSEAVISEKLKNIIDRQPSNN